MNGANAYTAAVAVGIFIALSWIATVVLAQLWTWVWNWIDDGANPITHNPIMRRLMARLGYEPESGAWAYVLAGRKGEFSFDCHQYADGYLAFFGVLAGALVVPLMLAAAFDFYPVTLTIITLYLLAHTARFARRIKKRFDKHEANPNAHKESHE